MYTGMQLQVDHNIVGNKELRLNERRLNVMIQNSSLKSGISNQRKPQEQKKNAETPVAIKRKRLFSSCTITSFKNLVL